MSHTRVVRNRNFTAKILTLVVLTSLVASAFQPIIASDQLVIRLDSGRLLHGELDVQTDDKRLWLNVSESEIVLSSAFAWAEIESIVAGSQVLTKADVMQLASALRAKATPEIQLAERIAFWFPKRPHVPEYDEPMFPERHVPVPPQPGLDRGDIRPNRQIRVSSLEIEARPMNWDRDSERDGLLVFVRPLDADGQIVPVSGQIRLQLFGERYAQTTRRTFDSSIHFPELGTWTQRLHVDDFGIDGAAIKLPYRRLHPDFDTDLAAHALLNARLGISGQGTFDASTADVFVRPASRYRDELFLRSPDHRRFLPAELP